MTTTTLSTLIESAKRATPGPWEVQTGITNAWVRNTGVSTITISRLDILDNEQAERNAAFIALANPAAILELGRAWEEMEAEVKKLRDDLAEADRNAAKLEVLLEPHIKWKEIP